MTSERGERPWRLYTRQAHPRGRTTLVLRRTTAALVLLTLAPVGINVRSHALQPI